MPAQPMRVLARYVAVACVLANGGICYSQSESGKPDPQVEGQAAEGSSVASELQQLRGMIEELRQENRESRAEMRQLREELQNTRVELEKLTAVTGPAPSIATGTVQPTQPLEARVENLEESQALLSQKVDQQNQTKVEAASKYRVRLSGIVLMNAFRSHGTANNLDYPDFAVASPGSPQSAFGATLRQSEIGLEAFGPNLAGAKTSANVQLDFAGGFPGTPNGVDFGLVRLKTATARFDWEHTSVVAGQDSLFISPLSPTSFASLATPAFAFAGNLWGWIPQIRVEHSFDISDGQRLTVQAGILDNLTWDFPPNQFYRSPGPGEQTGQPAYAVHTAWTRSVGTRELSFGTAGYYGRQNWGPGQFADGWAGMADWQVPITQRWLLSGEFYRGRGAGGLGAGIGRAVLFGSSQYGVEIRGVDSAGGWSQLKWQITPKVEINGVFAEDDVFSGDVRGFTTDMENGGTILGRNRGGLGNVIYRPKSDLILAAEFRRLRSFPIYSNSIVTNQLNLAVGILF